MVDKLADRVTLQAYFRGEWHTAAWVEFENLPAGHQSPTTLYYDQTYCFENDPTMTGSIRGIAALGARLPPRLEWCTFKNWPPFLLDLLPQGHGRTALANALGSNCRNWTP